MTAIDRVTTFGTDQTTLRGSGKTPRAESFAFKLVGGFGWLV